MRAPTAPHANQRRIEIAVSLLQKIWRKSREAQSFLRDGPARLLSRYIRPCAVLSFTAQAFVHFYRAVIAAISISRQNSTQLRNKCSMDSRPGAVCGLCADAAFRAAADCVSGQGSGERTGAQVRLPPTPHVK